MKKIFSLLFFVFVCNTYFFAQSSERKEEYAVYARVLRDIRSRELVHSKTKHSFVILNNTFNPDYFGEYKTGRFKSLSADFKRKNAASAKLEKSFPIEYEYEITSQPEINRFLEIGIKEYEKAKAEYALHNLGITGGSEIIWKPFYAKYPKANGYYQFSRIGFSSDKRFALVLVEGKGSVWSSNTEYILRKFKDKWTIYQAGGGFSTE